jgi:hypothetical protein
VVEAVDADRLLSPRQKQVLLDLYRALIDATTSAAEAPVAEERKRT